MPQHDGMFTGVGVALLTACNEAGAVDAESSAALAENVVSQAFAQSSSRGRRARPAP